MDWECRTAGHLVFWKLWPAVELKKVLSDTKHGFVFWAQYKPNTRLEIYKAFQAGGVTEATHQIVTSTSTPILTKDNSRWRKYLTKKQILKKWAFQ